MSVAFGSSSRFRGGASLALVLPLCGAGFIACGPPAEPGQVDNEPPIARATWPQRWPVDAPVPFDASTSEDVDGRLVRVSALFGDGSYEQTSRDARFEHLYAASGTYEVRVEVEDEAGDTAELIGRIVVVDRVEDPACSCELPCLDDGICTERGCFLAAVSEGVPDGFEGAPRLDDAVACD